MIVQNSEDVRVIVAVRVKTRMSEGYVLENKIRRKAHE